MPVKLEGSCHCKAVKYTVESNTPVPYQLCQCSICRKPGGYMGSVNIMGNTDTLKIIRGKEKIKQVAPWRCRYNPLMDREYIAVLEFDADDKPTKRTRSKRSFCTDCSSMLWLHDDAWAQWVYPFASSIDKPDPLPALPEGTTLLAIKRDSCAKSLPIPEGAKEYEGYGPGEGIEEWHKKNGAWVE